MNPGSKVRGCPPFFFPDWAERLRTDQSLTAGLRASYARTLEDFLEWCRRRGTGPTVALAPEYVELRRLETAPAPAGLEQWKEALNWLFRHARQAGAVLLTGVPPLARADLGRTSWEAALIARLRQEQRS